MATPSSPAPVLAVGSLTRRGSGKTPAAIAFCQRLTETRGAVHMVMHGTGAPRQVDPRQDTAETVGDEPLLAAAFAPTWIAQDPQAGIDAARAGGADLVILEEEGPATVTPALRVLVEDAVRGFGNRRKWLFGDLHTPMAKGFRTAQMLVTIGPRPAQAGFRDTPLPRSEAVLEPLRTGMTWRGARVLAFAGIGNPDRFFGTLRALGAEVVRQQPLADHQEMTPTLLARLEHEALGLGAQLVTTEKDAVRLPADFRPKVLVVPVRLELADWAQFDRLVAERL